MNEHFSFMYADLCRRITDNWSSGTVDDEVGLYIVALINYLLTLTLFNPLLYLSSGTVDDEVGTVLYCTFITPR